MLALSSENIESFLNVRQKLSKKQRQVRTRAEVILNARTTPNNVFICVAERILGHVFFWISKGRPQFGILKFNNMFSLERMFVEVTFFLKKFLQTVYCLKLRGRTKVANLSRQLKAKGVPVFYSDAGNRKPFNGCRLPHTRRI